MNLHIGVKQEKDSNLWIAVIFSTDLETGKEVVAAVSFSEASKWDAISKAFENYRKELEP